MDRAIYKYIERELYNYPSTIQLISDIQDEIIEDQGINYNEHIKPKFAVLRPTETKAIHLVTNLQLNRLIGTQNAIERGLKKLDEVQLQIFELQYIKNYKYKKILTIVPISESCFFKKRKKLIEIMAYEMGFQ